MSPERREVRVGLVILAAMLILAVGIFMIGSKRNLFSRKSRYYVEFSFKLDTSQLPRPMQFGIGGQADWTLGVERTLRVE